MKSKNLKLGGETIEEFKKRMEKKDNERTFYRWFVVFCIGFILNISTNSPRIQAIGYFTSIIGVYFLGYMSKVMGGDEE